jgi:hypothetical protein
VIISAGDENGYGHPDRESLQLYADHGAQVYRTDHHGTIIIDVAPLGAYTVRVERGEGAQPPPAPVPSPAPSNPAPLPIPAPVPLPISTPVATCIDVNTAPASRLEQIIHIGPARALEMISLRQARRFSSVSDLIRINGIGAARLKDIIREGKACVT